MFNRFLPILAVLISGLNAQNCSTFSTNVSILGGANSVELSLESSADTPPTALQWTFRYPLPAVSSLTMDAGPAVTAVGKTVICAPNPAGSTCLAMGSNASTVGNGVIAKVTIVLVPEVVSAPFELINPLGASAAGYFAPVCVRGSVNTTKF